MNLVPYTLTALSRQDIPDTPQNRNIVVGAVVTCTNALGANVTMFDDAEGANGSTAKQTGVNGQVTVFVEPDEYTFTVNGRPNKVVVGNPKQVSSVVSIDALRLQAGRFNGQQISLSGYYAGSTKGGGMFVWDSTSTAADDGGVTIAVTGVAVGRWVRQLDGFVTPEMFGARVDNLTNDRLAVLAWGQFVINSGVTGTAESSGICLIGSGITYTLNGSAKFDLPSGLIFKAASGFPAQKLFLFNTGAGSNHVFRWHGGQLNGENIPLSGAGQANDMFYFAASNCDTLDLDFYRTYSGESFLVSGSDSHVFVAGAKNIRVNIGQAVGAYDACVYVSGAGDGSGGDSCNITGNYEKSEVAVIVKRNFRLTTIDINCTDCRNGAGSGTATGSSEVLRGGDGFKVTVNAIRCNRPAFFQCSNGGVIVVNSYNMGVSIGSPATSALGVYISGSSGFSGVINTVGVNPDCVVNSGFSALTLDDRTINATNYISEGNFLIVNAKGVGRAVNETQSSNNNTFIIKENGNIAGSTLSGSSSVSQRVGSGVSSWNATIHSFLSNLGSKSLDIVTDASYVNYAEIRGASLASSSGVSLRSNGADADVPISIIPKGSGNTYVGGSAGLEGLRVRKGNVNNLEVIPSATGQPVVLQARGTDAAVNLRIAPKGVGHLEMASIDNYADDSAAAAGGVPIDGLYRTGSILKIRVA